MTAWRWKVNSNLVHPYFISPVRSNRTTRYRTGEIGPNFHPMFLYKKCEAACSSDIRAYWAQIRVFRQNEQETEKKHDCVAEESEFELASPLFLKLHRTEPSTMNE
jgi:hypothetical protein